VPREENANAGQPGGDPGGRQKGVGQRRDAMSKTITILGTLAAGAAFAVFAHHGGGPAAGERAGTN
jgi:hypothetical protein